MITFLALVSGESVVSSLIWLVCVAVCFWILWWLLDYIKIPDPFNRVARIILAIAAAIVTINVVMSLGGHPIFKW